MVGRAQRRTRLRFCGVFRRSRHGAGGPTRLGVVYYDVKGPGGLLTPFESFTLQRPRRDGK